MTTSTRINSSSVHTYIFVCSTLRVILQGFVDPKCNNCHHCHLISCVYIKGLVNTKDQSNACMCEMMSKGSKEGLTVLIVTHVTHVERVKRSLNSSNCYSCRRG